MSIEQVNTIDAIGIGNDSGKVVLTVSDHLEWDDEHLLLLQEKLNAYISFIESGELFDAYPDAKGRLAVINIVCKYSLNQRGLDFVGRLKNILDGAGIELSIHVSNNHQ